MRCPVNKALDKAPVNFGIRGSYIRFVGIGAAAALILGVLAGALTGFLIGFIVFVGGAAFVYFWVSNYQERVTEKERDQMFSAFTLPRRIRVRPLRSYRLLHAKYNRTSDLSEFQSGFKIKNKQ